MASIFEFIRDINFYQAIWLLPILGVIHSLEELPRFPDWAAKTLEIPYTSTKFIAENIVLFLILIAAIVMTFYVPGKAGVILVLSTAACFFLNAIFHAFFTLKTGVYSPGTVTACLFFVPASLYIYYLAGKEGLLTTWTLVLSIILGIVVLPIVVSIVHNTIDSGITFKALIKKVLIMGVLPFVVMAIAMMVFGRETVNTIMIYATPLIVLPLVLKTLKKMKEKKKSDTIS